MGRCACDEEACERQIRGEIIAFDDIGQCASLSGGKGVEIYIIYYAKFYC